MNKSTRESMEQFELGFFVKSRVVLGANYVS